MHSDAGCLASQGFMRSRKGVPGRTGPALQAIGLSGILGAGAFLALTSLRLPLVCPLRWFTGVPCPLCGMTTGTVAALRGDLVAALSANPFSVPFVAGVISGVYFKVKSAFAAPSAPWPAHRVRIAATALIVAASVSWIFQLARFGLV